ncbi:MAG TPA: TrkA family potassium uptake protein [Vicinamibacterales bacterium]|nr:TrkA family potassium uptake protein [Vicinamibacterales bacterium]
MATRHFAVIGLGRFGSSVATTLVELGQDVLGVDRDGANVQALADRVPHLLTLDAMDRRALVEAGMADIDVAIVSIGTNVETSLLIVMTLKELGVKQIIAKATTVMHGRILEMVGVDRVVYPEREVGRRMAHSLVVPNLLDYIGLSSDYGIIEIPAPAALVGRSLRDTALRATFGLTVIAIKRRGGSGQPMATLVAPSPDERIQAGDTLAIIGGNRELADFEKTLG